MNLLSPKVNKTSYLDSIWAFFFSKKSLLYVLGFVLFFYVISLWNRYIYIDDAWFGEQAYWFSKLGFSKASSIKDLYGWDQRLFVYHKLNIVIGAAIVKIFGWSVYYFKLFSLFIYALFFVVYARYFRFFYQNNSMHYYILASFFVFVSPLMISLSFTYRPEILIMFFGFLSYFLVEKYLKENKNSFLIFSGIFSGLAFLTHINGMVFAIAGFLVLIFNKRIKGVFYFSVTAFFTSILYFYDLWQIGHFQQFLFQMTHWPDDVGSNYNSSGIGGLLLNMGQKLLDEQQRFLWSDRVQASSILLFLALIASFKTLRTKHKTLLIYLLICVLSLNILGSQIAERYLIYFFPLFGIIFAVSVVDLFEQKKVWAKTLIFLIIVLQFAFTAKMFVEIFDKNQNAVAKHHKILQHIPNHKDLTLVPYEFVFNELETRNLTVYKGFEYYQKLHGTFTQKTFFERADKLGIKFIVLDDIILEQKDKTFPIFAHGKISENQYYKVFYQDSNALILESKR